MNKLINIAVTLQEDFEVSALQFVPTERTCSLRQELKIFSFRLQVRCAALELGCGSVYLCRSVAVPAAAAPAGRSRDGQSALQKLARHHGESIMGCLT
jgi:hypothetical protein